MIEIIEKHITIDQAQVEEIAAYQKPESRYALDILSFRCKKVTGIKWRLVHDGVSVIALIEGGITETIQEVLEFDTEKEALVAIETLGLEYDTLEVE